MSTVFFLCLQVRYSLSEHSLLLRIVVPDFMALGANLQWVSAFPDEAEVVSCTLHDQGLIHQCSVESLLIIMALAYFVPIHPRECGHISFDNNCLLVFPCCYRCSIPRLPTSNLGANQKGLR